jgi:hypothetical protein
MVALLAAQLHRLGAGQHLAIAEDQVGRRVVPDGMAAPLGLQAEHEGRIAIDVDARHMVHLDGDVQLHDSRVPITVTASSPAKLGRCRRLTPTEGS